jgi:thioesterase domain-containing protein/acyl carrier protein
MIPSVCFALDSMPLTTSGKIKRGALPCPEEISKTDIESSTPKNLLEWQFMQIWMKLFNLQAISRQSNFFDLGGHSLLAVQLAAKVEKLLGKRLPIASLFQSPTIESLANRLVNENWTPHWASLVPLQPLGSKTPFFFVYVWGGDVYVFLNLARSLAADQPVYGLQSDNRKRAKRGMRSVEELASHYVEEIRSFQAEGPYYLGGYSLGGWIAYEIARQLTEQGQKVQMLAFLDTGPCCRLPTLMHFRVFLPGLAGRVGFHARQFFKRNLAEQVDYVKGRWTALRHILWTRLRQPLPEPVTPQGANTTPAPSEEFEDGDDYQALCERYRPVKYSGSVDLFMTEEMDPDWPKFLNKLVKGGVKIHRVPGDHHGMMMKPEYLTEVAEVFGNALEAAQEAQDSVFAQS